MWEDLDQQSENLDITNEFDQSQCSLDAASKLLSEEEQMLADNDDDDEVRYKTVATEEVNGQSDMDKDVEINFSSPKLNSNHSSAMDYFELLNNVNELMKESSLLVQFMRNHALTDEYIRKQITSISNGNKTELLILDMFIRWNSSFLLLDRLIIHKGTLNSMFAFPNNLFGLNVQHIK